MRLFDEPRSSVYIVQTEFLKYIFYELSVL